MCSPFPEVAALQRPCCESETPCAPGRRMQQPLLRLRLPCTRPQSRVATLLALCCTACLVAAAAASAYQNARPPPAADDRSRGSSGGAENRELIRSHSWWTQSRADTDQQPASSSRAAAEAAWHESYVAYRQERDRRRDWLTVPRRSGSSSNKAQQQLRKCNVIPPRLVGSIPVNPFPVRLADLEAADFALRPGGHYEPPHCRPRSLVAIVIPFRARWEHLARWLLHMHPLLQRQELGYTIYVINQEEGSQFNRGMLMNVGYNEARKIRPYDCFIFHDVDLLPENDRNLYNCPFAPRHMSAAVDKFGYALPYADIAGGVIAIGSKEFEKLNGFSNLFFGWGGEDDDFSFRIQASGFRLTRYKHEIARYKMFKHITDSGNEVNAQRYELLKSSKERRPLDGLNTLSYAVKNIQFRTLFTWISVAVNKDEIMSRRYDGSGPGAAASSSLVLELTSAL